MMDCKWCVTKRLKHDPRSNVMLIRVYSIMHHTRTMMKAGRELHIRPDVSD
jgi:hypothetical protein